MQWKRLEPGQDWKIAALKVNECVCHFLLVGDNMNEKYMTIALKEAKKAFKKNEVPIGTVIIKNNKIIAIEKACKKLKTWHLNECILYTTVEPCLMCSGAIIQSRIKKVIFATTNEKYGELIKEMYGIEVIVPTNKFPRIKLADLYEELEKRYGYTVPDSAKVDLTTEAEKLAYKFAKEEYNSEFIFVTDYPKDKRAFYHLRINDIPQGYDLIWRGVEITTGAQREHRYDILKKQAEEKGLSKDVEFYLDFFKYGCPPHGGFGIGVDRLTMLLLNLPSLKESMFLFRGPNRLNP